MLRRFEHLQRRRLLHRSLAAGLLAALAVGALGWLTSGHRPQGWQAQAQVVVLPGATISPHDLAVYYDTLSRGQLVATGAEIVNQASFRRQAAAAARVPATQVSLRASVVPNTALVSVVATAPTRPAAERVADLVVALAEPTADRLLAPYDLSGVSPAEGTAVRTGLSLPAYVGLVAGVAVVVGLALQQLVQQLAMVWRREASRG